MSEVLRLFNFAFISDIKLLSSCSFCFVGSIVHLAWSIFVCIDCILASRSFGVFFDIFVQRVFASVIFVLRLFSSFCFCW